MALCKVHPKLRGRFEQHHGQRRSVRNFHAAFFGVQVRSVVVQGIAGNRHAVVSDNRIPIRVYIVQQKVLELLFADILGVIQTAEPRICIEALYLSFDLYASFLLCIPVSELNKNKDWNI